MLSVRQLNAWRYDDMSLLSQLWLADHVLPTLSAEKQSFCAWLEEVDILRGRPGAGALGMWSGDEFSGAIWGQMIDGCWVGHLAMYRGQVVFAYEGLLEAASVQRWHPRAIVLEPPETNRAACWAARRCGYRDAGPSGAIWLDEYWAPVPCKRFVKEMT